MHLFVERVMVKSSDNGERFISNVGKLSRKDGEPVTERDLQKGSSMLAEIGGYPYPVEVVGLEGMH